MDDVRNPIYAAEPYQESQGRDSPNAASPDALTAFYKDMEQKEVMERKLSKRRSNSIWSRKSVKRSTAPAVAPVQKHQSQPNFPSEAQRGDEEREMERLEEQRDAVPQTLNSSRSIIPDSAKDLPAWYTKETSSPLLAFKLRYNIHSPVGPRWYQNHHLIPPSHVRPATRPPSVFSPSFPPMASSTSQDRSEDATRMPGPSRTPSNSPLPTPNSSQTRVEDSGAKPRSRKTSQTAHDNVDLLDVTDPWGTNWHHQSPYDIGLSNGPISVDVQDALQTRTRRSSMTTAQSRRKTVTPSPLSQSTSVVHLHDPDVGNHLPRKLSKRRTPLLGNIFGGETQQPDHHAVSLPVTPVEHDPVPPDPSVLPKRLSVAHINDLHSHPTGTTPKKEKRGSVLGRLVKKFSILRKPTADQRRVTGREDDWQHVSNDDKAQQRFVTGGQISPEKEQIDSTKRIPPPLSDAPSVKVNVIVPDTDRSSSVSIEAPFEAPFSMGRLTITNPDAPGSSDNTPTQGAVPLLPDKSEMRERGRPSLQITQGDGGPVDSDLHTSSARLSSETQPPVVPDKSPPPASLSPISANRDMGSSEVPPVISSTISSKAVSTTPVHSHDQPVIDVQSLETRSKTQSPPIGDLSHKLVLSPGFNPSGNLSPFENSTFTSPSPSVPVHVTETTDPGLPTPDSPASCNYSPLSTTSMLANPPTPYTADLSMPPSPEPLPSPLPPTSSQDRTHSLREPSPASRQTETFKLVRSSSSNVYASSETIVAGGQQWEVVESAENKLKGRASAKANDRDTGGRRDQRREGRHTAEMKVEAEDRPRNRSYRSHKPPQADHAASNSITPVADHSNERPGRSKGARRKEDGGRTSDRKRSTSFDVNKPQPPPPPSTPGAPPTRQLERQPSTSARPTSELPSAAEMNALRAKEAWDLERLWKARSVYGNDSRAYTSATVPLAARDEKGAQADSHGSSHTAFVVQSPFQSQPSHIYHSMPTIPTPIVYSSTSVASASQQFTSSHRQSGQQQFRNLDPRAASTSRIPLNNPLPAPPRASAYEPTPLSF